MSYRHYRNTTVGIALQETLEELIRENKMTRQLANRVLAKFDDSIAASFDCATESLFGFSAKKLEAYRLVDDVWTIVLKDVKFLIEGEEFTEVDKVRVVACDGRDSNWNENVPAQEEEILDYSIVEPQEETIVGPRGWKRHAE